MDSEVIDLTTQSTEVLDQSSPPVLKPVPLSDDSDCFLPASADVIAVQEQQSPVFDYR